jgi:hypothetical protein
MRASCSGHTREPVGGQEENYDTILWIDVRSEGTARSSYKRCCRALCLPTKAAKFDLPLQEIPSVQVVLLRTTMMICRGT